MPRQDPGEPYYRVDSNEARQILDSDPGNTVVVDVRRDDEWVTGHVAGAIHIPIRRSRLPHRPSAAGQKTVVHLRGRRPQRAGLRGRIVNGVRHRKPLQH